MATMRVSLPQVVNFRLAVNNISQRLPAGAYVAAAFVGLQDTAPRDALLGLHARVMGCESSAWEDPGLVQTYSPRKAVYVLPKADLGVFTVGRLPRDPKARQAIEDAAEQACRLLSNPTAMAKEPAFDRGVCATGRIVVRWTASSVDVSEQPRPSIDPEAARIELGRRHIHAFGPTTPAAFAWWAGVPVKDAKETFAVLANELRAVDFDGHESWVLAADEAAVMAAEPMRGVRFLAAPDLRLFGQDKTGLYVGPGLREHTPGQDWFHPNGLLVDGRLVGAWGRRAGRVTVKASRLSNAAQRAVREEGETIPIPGSAVTVSFG